MSPPSPPKKQRQPEAESNGEVRAKAKRELGDKFVLKDFCNTVLRAGVMPLAVRETVIDDYRINGR